MSATARDANDLGIEQFTIEQIPPEQRHGRPRDLFTIWFTSNLMPLTVVTGALATVTFKLPFIPAVIAILVGNLVGAILMALHSAQGPKLGIPQMIQSRAQYGIMGSILVVVVVVFMYVGFFASNLVLGGDSIHQLAPAISIDWAITISAVLSLVVATYGYNLIHGINRWLAIVFALVMVVATIVMCVRGLPAHFLSIGTFSWTGFMAAVVSIGVLWQIAYAPYVSDYSRYMPSDVSVKPVFWNSYWGVVLGSAGPMVIGAILGLATTNTNLVAGMDKLTGGFGWVVMLVFAIGIIDTNSINAYGGVLCTITVGQNFKERWLPKAKARGVFAFIFIAVCLYLAIVYQTTFLTSYYNLLLMLLYLLVPWTTINLIDFYIINRGIYDVPSLFKADGGIYGRYNWGTILLYVVGFGIEVPFVNTTLYEGPVAKAMGGTDISWLVAIVIIAPAYYFYARWRHGAAGPSVDATVAPGEVEASPTE
jgi:NCS1 family nucleobase:cation symporter-1